MVISQKKTSTQQIEQITTQQFSKSELNSVIHEYSLTEYSLKNNHQEYLNEKDLATVRDLKPYFDKRTDIIIRYHLDYYASKEEAEKLAILMLKASNMVVKINNNHDFIDLFEYLIILKGKLSKYNHKKYKYRWSVSLEILCCNQCSVTVFFYLFFI